MKILCLFVRHGITAYPEALTILDAWYQRHGLLSSRTLWIIDNALPTDTPVAQSTPDIFLRPGDNQSWEFSAWARALDEACDDLAQYNVIHFVTSAFHTLYTGYLEHFRPEMLEFLARRPSCLGHIDSYDHPVVLDGTPSSSWIRTCFFFLPARLARKVAPWARLTETDQVFDSPDSTQFREVAPLTMDHQQRIRIWLEGQNVGGYTWHSPVTQASGEVLRFQQKTLAILNEHYLSVTLRQHGVQLIDFCWLYTAWSEVRTSIPLLPTETEQLKVRRRVLGIPEPAG